MTFTTHQGIRSHTARTWTIDPAHSEIAFSVRHTMVGRVSGRFTAFSGQIVVGETPLDSSAVARVEMRSIDTGNTRRDNHLRSPDFFDIDVHPTMDLQSTALRQNGSQYVLDGQLTIKDITKPISLNVELQGFGHDAGGDMRVRFTANGELDRSDFGVDFNLVLKVGGVLIADRVDIHLELEAFLNR